MQSETGCHKRPQISEPLSHSICMCAGASANHDRGDADAHGGVKSYDYILVDSPAGIDSGFDLAVCAADKVVVVTTPQVAAVHDADCVLRLLRRKKDISTYLLINSFRKQLVKEGNMLQISDICELLNTELLGVVLEDEHIIISQNHGESMMGKKGTSQTCYENICRRLVGEAVPIPDFLQEKHRFRGFFWNKPAKQTINS